MNDRTDAITVTRGAAEGQQSVSVSGASAATTDAIGGSPECLVYSTVECFALAGASPSATVALGTPIPANTLIRVRGLRAGDKLAFITSGGTGTAYVRPGA
jgi:hypothetical protein